MEFVVGDALLLGAVGLAGLAVKKNELGVDFGIFGIEALGGLELDERSGVAMGLGEEGGGEAAPFEIFRIETNGLDGGVGSLRPLLERLIGDSLEMEGVGVFWIGF